MRTRTALGLVLLIAASGCSANTFIVGDGDGGGSPPPVGGGNGDGGAQPDVAAPPPNCDTKKLPTDDACVINEAEGVFVSASRGLATGDGTMAKPLASLGAGIAAAQKAGKRVYACAETYPEAIALEDGVSVFGYFDCANGWSVGSSHAKVESPTSPAANASNIVTATRVEAVDIVAPDFTDQSKSSVGLLASASPALTIVHATIHAGTGGKGSDGANGIQLADSGVAKNGANAWADGVCVQFCVPSNFLAPAGGANACSGEAGHDGGPGGAGGHPGQFLSSYYVNGFIWAAQDPGTTAGSPTAPTSQTAQGGAIGAAGAAGAPGADGSSGAPGASIGAFGANGYVPSDGTSGTAGAPGQGGGGSGGYNNLKFDYPAGNYSGKYGWAEPGAGGGAGGCPGLAGQGGHGGGASVAVLALGSSFTLDTVALEASAGGAAGASGAPSAPTAGGLGGKHAVSTLDGGNGGAGGHGGVSGNGGGGPSVGLAYQGTKPTLLASTIKQGAGGAGVAQRVVNGQTVVASPDGLSKDVYSF